MEFKVTKNANILTLTLIVVGLLFTGIGIATSMGDHNLNTRIAGNLLIDSFFFFGIGLGALFFLALQYATETGWYASVKRVIEAVSGFLPVGIILMAVTLLIITLQDGAHLYIWMDDEVVKNDEILQGKSTYLNKGFFWIRTVIYLSVYYIYYRGFRKRSLLEDTVGGTDIHFTNYKKAAVFLVFFAVFSSMQSWDWIMSVDAHWFSTLFGWYVFSGMWCTTMITLVTLTLYLKKNGYLPNVNESHIHDLGKWTFATSFLWSYLWFSQFMLIWYANIPEETTYHLTRIKDFRFLYFGMFLVNFAFPMVLLMSRDAKRHAGILTFVGAIVLVGHWVDVYVMIMAGSMGEHARIGFLEIGLLLAVLGLFLKTILKNLTKAPLSVVNHPFLDESIHHDI